MTGYDCCLVHDVALLMNQIIKEVMRWRPVLSMGIPYSNTVPDELDGYYILPNSLAFGNMRAMQHNPKYYHNPEEFIPERYDGNQKSAFGSSIESDAMARNHYIFGWGSTYLSRYALGRGKRHAVGRKASVGI